MRFNQQIWEFLIGVFHVMCENMSKQYDMSLGAALCKTPSVVGTNKVSQKIGILWYTIHTPT